MLENACADKVSIAFREWLLAGVFRDDDSPLGQQRCVVLCEEAQRCAVVFDGLIRRVEEDDIRYVQILDHPLQETSGAAVFDRIAALELQRGDIGTNSSDSSRSLLGEPAELRTATQGFDAYSARTRVEIDEASALNTRCENIKQGFT